MRRLGNLLLDDGTSSRNERDGGNVVPLRGRNNGTSPTVAYIIQEIRRERGLSDGESSDSTSTEETSALLSRVAQRLGFDLTSFERDEICAYFEKEQRPFGILQDLVDDPAVTDIIVTDYSKVAVQQGRRNFNTDIVFPSPEVFEVFVEKLLQRAGTTFSTKKPIADGMIGSFARVHAVHPSICDSGPYLTIRLNRFATVSVRDLIAAGLAPESVLSYLTAVVVTGHTLLIVGEVGTGKTTLARAIASSMPQEESIIVIEDTPEIRLEHPHVRYLTTREANIEGAGRVSPSECIRGGMRMAMNRIVFGEIRDAEAAEAFIDVCASGHPGLSTIHARSAIEAIKRLELFLGRAQKGVTEQVLSEQVATAVQVIVYVGICRHTGKRRIMEVKEIGPLADGVIRQRDLFKYQLQKNVPAWRVVNKVSGYRERIEEAPEPIILSNLPSVIELSLDVLYKEASGSSGGRRL